jgi:hypothetical protein
MTNPRPTTPFRPVLACIVLLLAAAPTWACSDKTASRLDWAACWSFSRLGLWGITAILSWLFVFHILFPHLLQPGRLSAPWPRDALGRSLAVFWCLFWMFCLVFFAGFNDELRNSSARFFPAGSVGNFLNRSWLMMLVILVMAVGAGLILWLVRHPRHQAAT